MLVIFTKGGYVMLPILLCSIIALAVVIERIFTFQRKKFLPGGLLIEVEDLVKDKRFPDATISCKKNDSIIARLLLAVIQNKDKSDDYIKSLVNERGQREFEITGRPLQVLSTIASISPLLGLLGTVVGMVKVFSVISVEGVGNPTILAAGISEALFTTVAGLVVAIPTFIAFKYYQSKLRVFAVILEEEAHRFIEVVKNN